MNIVVLVSDRWRQRPQRFLATEITEITEVEAATFSSRHARGGSRGTTIASVHVFSKTLAIAAPLDPVAGQRPALHVAASVFSVFSVAKHSAFCAYPSMT